MRRSLSKVVAIAVLSLGAMVAVAAVVPSANAKVLRRQQMLHLMNHARADHGAGRLNLQSSLVHYARHHSKKMANRGYIFHTASLSNTLRGMTWRVAGENVGAGGDTKSLFRAFMNSSEHRRNILRSNFKHVGIGLVRSGDYLWATIIFYG